MGENKSDVLQGTLDLMVLKTLESMGTLHGYGIARRIEQVSDNKDLDDKKDLDEELRLHIELATGACRRGTGLPWSSVF